MIKCPSCSYENVDGTQFCEGCGEELTAGAASATSAAGAPAAGATAPGTIKCPACDNLNPAENVVCEVCGTELRTDTAATGSAADFSGAPTAPAAAPIAATSTTDAGLAPDASGLDVAASTAATPSTAPAASTVSSTPFDAALPSSAVATAATASTVPMPDDLADIPAPQTGAPQTAKSPTDAAPDASLQSGSVQSGAPDIAPSPTVPAMPDVADAGAGVATAPAVAPVPSPVSASATPGNLQPGMVKLVVEQGMSVGKQFVLGDSEILVGREDEEESIYPDIDLSDQDEGYVHRRHATLKFENGNLLVTHLGGANKTRINNRPLPDNEPQPVQIGDKVAFGKVVLRVQSQA